VIGQLLHKIHFYIFPLILVSAILCFPKEGSPASDGKESGFDINGMMQVYGIALKNPYNRYLYRDNDRSGIAGIGRVIINAQMGESLSLEANAYQTYIPTDLVVGQSGGGIAITDVERSSAFEWSFSDDRFIHAAVDRLNLRWSKDRLDIILGRQPINLATTFYFTPNDFFAPFAAHTFYRVYKPGVDALRAEVRLGNFSQLSLIGVLGYRPDEKSDTGWGRSPDADRASYIGRISKNFHDFEFAFIAGTFADADVIGGSLQGELFKWLGVRAEGNMAFPDVSGQDNHMKLAMGIEHHWENSLDIRLEFFYQGNGVDSASGYAFSPSQDRGATLYLGRRYSALGIGYEFTPLLTGQTALVGNLTDNSVLASFNAVYSLSNESELSFGLALPFGKKPEGLNIRSEFGMSPRSVSIEWRWYF
jgi:hypothetical protein